MRNLMTLWRKLTLVTLASMLLAGAAFTQERPFVTLATTTSTQDSGLLDDLLPKFSAASGIDVRVVAVGTGRAIELGKNGDADVLLVHDRASEDAFVAEGHASARRDVMYNDFLVIGPSTDPAGAKGQSAATVFQRIADTHAAFISRGDDSGTHKAEKRLWAGAARDPLPGSGVWYFEAGGGMGATLVMASEKLAYTLTDRATWLALKDPRGLAELASGDPRLRNNYGVMVLSSVKHPGVKAELTQQLADWLTGAAGREAIASFQVAGKQVFFLE